MKKIFIFSERLGEFQWNFQEKCKVTKNHGFTLSLQNTILEKPPGGGGQIDPPATLLGLNYMDVFVCGKQFETN